jgi:hypothetical protein
MIGSHSKVNLISDEDDPQLKVKRSLE